MDLRLGESLQIAKDGGLLGNVVDASGTITQRARFEAVQGAAGTVAQINPAIMLMAIAIQPSQKNSTKLKKRKRYYRVFTMKEKLC